MAEQAEFDCDRLRPLNRIHDPDPRNAYFVSWDEGTGEFLPSSVQEQHATVAAVTLHSGVPEDVAIQLETTKNIYLYAWFVYRFYPVAQHHALTCLELALRIRFWSEIRANAVPHRGKKPMLRELLRYAIASGIVTNHGFAAWHEMVRSRARYRVEQERFLKMRDENIERMVWNESEVVITEEDRRADYVDILLETIPTIRNIYAHGSTTLDNQGLHTIQTVAEIINQLFPRPSPLGCPLAVVGVGRWQAV